MKYLSPKGAGSQLYILQGPPFGKVLTITEGEFKTLALCEADIRAVGLGGITSAMPQGELLPDLKKILRQYRPHTVLFVGDADTALNFAFSVEAVKLAKALPQGCILKLPRIPLTMPNGIDDCKEKLGDGFLPFWQEITQTAIEVDLGLSASSLAIKVVTQELPAISARDNKDIPIQRILELASHLDPLHLESLAKTAKQILGLPLSGFRESAKQIAGVRKKQSAEKIRQDHAKSEHSKPHQ